MGGLSEALDLPQPGASSRAATATASAAQASSSSDGGDRASATVVHVLRSCADLEALAAEALSTAAAVVMALLVECRCGGAVQYRTSLQVRTWTAHFV